MDSIIGILYAWIYNLVAQIYLTSGFWWRNLYQYR